MVPFGGWEMPVQYTSILDEARAVRRGAGIFDVSHMGRLNVQGRDAATFLDRVLSFDVPGMRVGRARYGVICNEQGGIIDDCITYRTAQERYLVVPNASNTAEVLDWFSRWVPPGGELDVEEVTTGLAMIALQGPRAADLLAELTPRDLSTVRPFSAVETPVAGIESLVARTGYTGEDGFELIVPGDRAVEVWQRLLENGAALCGLGARDVLRLEAGLLLHGNDMGPTDSPYDAGLSRYVDPDRPGYIAGESLRRMRDEPRSRALAGFKMLERGIARHGYRIMEDANQIGTVTSGSYSPTLDRNIGLGYVPGGFVTPGSRFHVEIRARLVEAEIVVLPFYSRKKGP